MQSKTANLEPHTDFLWTREDYEELVEKGIFGPEDKVELLNGRIVTMSPQDSPHATACALVSAWLGGLFSKGYTIRIQFPLALDDRSEPEPDIAVVRGGIRDYTDHHPGAADTILIVEISDSSLKYDRGDKLAAYALAGIPEYWIVNLVDTRIERHRSPAASGYEDVVILGKSESIAPMGFEASAVAVAELMP